MITQEWVTRYAKRLHLAAWCQFACLYGAVRPKEARREQGGEDDCKDLGFIAGRAVPRDDRPSVNIAGPLLLNIATVRFDFVHHHSPVSGSGSSEALSGGPRLPLGFRPGHAQTPPRPEIGNGTPPSRSQRTPFTAEAAAEGVLTPQPRPTRSRRQVSSSAAPLQRCGRGPSN